MNTSKKILSIIGFLAIILVLFFTLKNVSLAPTTETGNTNEINMVNLQPPELSLPLSNAPKDEAWALFQKYLAYNKTQNLDGVRSVVYKVASVCDDPKTAIDCKGRMGQAYYYGSVLKKEDFVNVWSDDRQIILATDFRVEENDYTMRRVRGIIFFVRNEAGELKMLSFSPFSGAVTDKGTASRQELDDRLIIYTEDRDEDGIASYKEECLGIKEGEICAKTNSKIRDTNGDGLWDGVEALMNKNF